MDDDETITLAREWRTLTRETVAGFTGEWAREDRRAEVAAAQLLLTLEVEGAVVGADRLQVIERETAPELLLVVLVS